MIKWRYENCEWLEMGGTGIWVLIGAHNGGRRFIKIGYQKVINSLKLLVIDCPPGCLAVPIHRGWGEFRRERELGSQADKAEAEWWASRQLNRDPVFLVFTNIFTRNSPLQPLRHAPNCTTSSTHSNLFSPSHIPKCHNYWAQWSLLFT